MIELLLQLLLAHIIGDFVLQPQKWVKSKEKKKVRSPYLYLHILIHAVMLLMVLQFNIKYWLGIIIIIVSHFIIDLIKLYLIKSINNRWLFLWDQIAHLLVIVGVVNIYATFKINIAEIYSPKILLFIISILFITSVSSIIMKIVISKWEIKGNSKGKSLNDAGQYIGILERLLIFVFIISDNWEAIGFLLAAKSIFRFGDLSKSDDRKLTEYILIGTLLSFGFAIAIGVGYNYLMEIINLH
tara:strand:- start:33846 stop:34571 length:726 start_codon:yes stop_codon:yes gene_type:complete